MDRRDSRPQRSASDFGATGGHVVFSFGISYFDSDRFSVAKSVITFFSVS